MPPDTARATTTFVCEIEGRDFFVRTGDVLAVSHPVVAAHPTRFDHYVGEAAVSPVDPPAADLASQ